MRINAMDSIGKEWKGMKQIYNAKEGMNRHSERMERWMYRDPQKEISE